MAFGTKVRTTDGMADLANVRSIRLIGSGTPTAHSGSVTLSGYSLADTYIYMKHLDQVALAVETYWSGSTFYWGLNASIDLSRVRILIFSCKGDDGGGSWGFRAFNQYGDTVITNVLPAMGLKRSFTASAAATEGGRRYFYDSRLTSQTDAEVMCFKLSVGQWVAPFGFRNNAGNPPGIVSNQSSLAVAVFDAASNLPAPSGWGAAVYNSGTLMWHHDMALSYMVDTHLQGQPGSLPSSGTILANLPGNAIALSGGCASWSSVGGVGLMMLAERTSTNNVRLRYHAFNAPSGFELDYRSALMAISARAA